MKYIVADRVAGAILVGLGGLAVTEAIRLYPLRIRAFVGDDTFVGGLGGILLILGVLFLFVFKPQDGDQPVKFPTGELRRKILVVLGLLFVYWLLLPIVGYSVSTLIIAVGLFRTMGSYSWLRCILFAAVLVTVFYAMFDLWLQTPFPQPTIGMFKGGN